MADIFVAMAVWYLHLAKACFPICMVEQLGTELDHISIRARICWFCTIGALLMPVSLFSLSF